MLTPEDRNAIEGLFSRLAEAERRAPQRDAEAETLINRELVRQPAAPYYLAQTVVVQQQALEQAEQRIADLERQLAERERGGMFGGLFDDGRGRQNRTDDRQVQANTQRNRGPWDRDESNGRGQGGGFLAGAAQTALGVAGGVLLGSMIGSMLGAGAAHAAAPDNSQSDNGAEAGQDSQQDSQQDSDFGQGDSGFGGDDGFDMGGDF
jgi:hypothetical protein